VSTEFEGFEEEDFDDKGFSFRTLTRTFGLLAPYKLRVLAFVAIVGSVSALDSVFTWFGMLFIDEGIMAGDRARLIQLMIYYAGLALVQAALVFGFIYITGILGERVRYDLRKRMFNHLQGLSLSYYNKTPVGWIISRVTSDSDRVAELMTWGLLDVTWSTLNIAVAVFFMMRINAQLASIVLLLIPVIIIVAIYFQRKIIKEYRQVRKINSKITGRYNETITGVRVIKALTREQENLNEFGELTGSMYRAGYRAAWLSALFLPTVQIISALAIGAIVFYTGATQASGTMTFGAIQAFVSYVLFMVWPVQEMARVFAEMQQSLASSERIFSLLDAQPDVADRTAAQDYGSLRKEIVFDNVTFRYEEGKPVLDNFNLTVQPGEMIALVGPTGGGKSTIVNLLCRFFEPVEGKVTIGGVDYEDMTLHAIQSRIGMVLQTPHLFSGTIRENLRYGRLDATDAEIEEAAVVAGADVFIRQLEKGYEEQVGEGGVLLSTGQKQLISLARAVLAKPDIFVMDEATSSVDTMTEALIQQGMDRLLEQCTSFVIAHRLSTIKNADRILVIENGRIAEMGSHSELLHQHGHYYRLYTRQFRQELEAELDPWAVAEESAESEEAEIAALNSSEARHDASITDAIAEVEPGHA